MQQKKYANLVAKAREIDLPWDGCGQQSSWNDSGLGDYLYGDSFDYQPADSYESRTAILPSNFSDFLFFLAHLGP